MSEIINSCESLNGLNDFDALNFDWNYPKQTAVNVHDLNATLITPVKQIEEPPATDHNQSKSELTTAIASPGPSNITYFDPIAMSTPARVNGQLSSTICRETTVQQQQQFNSFNSFDSTPISPSVNSGSTIISPQIVYQYATNTILPTVSQFQTQPIVINVPYDPKPTSSIPSTVVPSHQSYDNSIEIDRLNRQIQSGPVRVRGYRDKQSRFKRADYVELEHLDPSTIPPKVNEEHCNTCNFVHEEILAFKT